MRTPPRRSEGATAYVSPSIPASLERAASWSWRLLVCAAATLSVLIVLRYLSVIVLPVMFALTIAPALTPVAEVVRKGSDGRQLPSHWCSALPSLRA